MVGDMLAYTAMGKKKERRLSPFIYIGSEPTGWRQATRLFAIIYTLATNGDGMSFSRTKERVCTWRTAPFALAL